MIDIAVTITLEPRSGHGIILGINIYIQRHTQKKEISVTKAY
jgi:hypothetical protein